MKSDPIRSLRSVARMADAVADQIKRLRSLTVPAASKFTGIPKEEIRGNCKIVRVNKRRHTVTLDELESYQARRTTSPL